MDFEILFFFGTLSLNGLSPQKNYFRLFPMVLTTLHRIAQMLEIKCMEFNKIPKKYVQNAFIYGLYSRT